MADRATLLFLSGFNLAFTVLVMGAAGLSLEAGHVAPRFVVLLGFLLVGLQVGQTIGFQVAAGQDVSETLVTRMLLLSVLAAFIALLFAPSLPQGRDGIEPILVTALSVGFGLMHGIRGAKGLLTRGRLAFQRHLFWRNLSFGAALILAAGIFEDEFAIMMAASIFCVVLALGTRRNAAGPHASDAADRNNAQASTITLGVLASLLYRNDVNVVRFALGGTENFVALHYGLTAYSALVAFAGFLVANFLYPKLRDARVRLDSVTRKLPLLALLLVPPTLVALWSERYPVLIVMLIPVVGLLGPVASAFMHSDGRSRFVYLTGAFWFCLVLLSPLLLLEGGADVLKHFLGYLLVVVLTLSAGLRLRAAGA